MIFYQITFGLYNKKTYEAAEELIEDYLSTLKSRGQIDKHYNIVPWQGQVVAYVSALGLTADRQKSHCESGKERWRHAKSLTAVTVIEGDGGLKLAPRTSGEFLGGVFNRLNGFCIGASFHNFFR